MATENEVLGYCRCPVCRSPKARAKVSAKGKAYVTCNACNVQIMARSAYSDMCLRQIVTGPVEQAEKRPAPPVPPAGQAIEVPAALVAERAKPAEPTPQAEAAGPAKPEEKPKARPFLPWL